MTERCITASYSIPESKVKWLVHKKKTGGLPESYYVNKGLDLVMGIDKIDRLKLLVLPLIYFFMGGTVFIFGVILSLILPLPITIMLLICGALGASMGGLSFNRGVTIWRRTSVY